MTGSRSSLCTCPLCSNQVDMPRALRALRADETGHERGCECSECEQFGPRDVRDVLECERKSGVHEWFADLYISVIQPGRCDLLNAPEWARELAIIGDNERARQRKRNRRRQDRNARNAGRDLSKRGRWNRG